MNILNPATIKNDVRAFTSYGYKLIFTAIVLMFIVFANCAVADIAVIVAKESNIDSLSKAQIKQIFLKKTKQLPNGASVIPVLQPDNSEIFDDFNFQVLDKTKGMMVSYWSKLIFSGKGSPPDSVNNSNAVKNFVKNTKGGIGYIYISELDSTVKAVFRTD